MYVSLDYSKEEIEKRFIENKIKMRIEKKLTLLVNNATINLTMDRIMEDVPCFKAKDNDHIKAGGSLVSIFLR